MRRSPLRSRAKPVDRKDPARIAWKTPQAGWCQCGCNRFAWHLERHHIVALQTIRREGRADLAYDLRNALLLHPTCHARHTSAMRRIPRSAIPREAFEFAVELLGYGPAALYMARFYASEAAA